MQLKTMLIGTGTLAIAAASLTLTRAAAALPATGPEKRATDNPVLSLNITFVPEDLQGTLQPGNIVKVIGVQRDGGSGPQVFQVKGAISFGCSNDDGWLYYYYNPNTTQLEGGPIVRLETFDVTIGEKQIYRWTIPYIIPPPNDSGGEYQCRLELQVDVSGTLARSKLFPVHIGT